MTFVYFYFIGLTNMILRNKKRKTYLFTKIMTRFKWYVIKDGRNKKEKNVSIYDDGWKRELSKIKKGRKEEFFVGEVWLGWR